MKIRRPKIYLTDGQNICACYEENVIELLNLILIL